MFWRIFTVVLIAALMVALFFLPGIRGWAAWGLVLFFAAYVYQRRYDYPKTKEESLRATKLLVTLRRVAAVVAFVSSVLTRTPWWMVIALTLTSLLVFPWLVALWDEVADEKKEAARHKRERQRRGILTH